MKSRLRFAVLIIAAGMLGQPLFAWGPIGHRIIGRIAQNHLTPEAARAVDALIGPETLAQVSTWADFIKSDPAWEKASPWHYVDIPDGETYATMKKNPKGDVVWAIRHFSAVLRDPKASRSDKQVALKFLVHFVGDVHQPLHVGRPSDRGGNDIKVTWHGQPANLHQVWDSFMIDDQKLSYTEYAAFLDHPTPEQIKHWQDSGVLDWVRESYDLRKQAYDIGNGQLGFKYTYKNLPIVEHRLLQAGVRLAGLLNSIFSPPAPPHPAP